MPSTIFIVDDEKNIRRTVRMVLEGEGFNVEEASSGEEALARLPEVAADVLLLDVQLPGISGLDTIERIAKLKNQESQPTIIMISGHATLADAVRATKAGAYDFIEKPLNLERLLVVLQNVSGVQDLARENQALRKQVQKGRALVGESAPMKHIQELIRRVAPTDRLRAHHRRERHGQRARRALHPLAEPSLRKALRGDQLRGHSRGADRVGALRPRTRRLHRSHRPSRAASSRWPRRTSS